MRKFQKASHGSRRQIVCIAIVGLFCLSCIVLSGLTPRLDFEVGIQPSSSGSVLVVKRVSGGESAVQSGDIIDAVDGKSIRTRAELYHALLMSEKDVLELTVKRSGTRYQRVVSREDFADGRLPAGVRSEDVPEFMADETGNYTHLENVDWVGLQSMLRAKDEGVSVIFKRPEEVLDVKIGLLNAIGRTLSSALVLLILPMMVFVAYRSRRRNRMAHPIWTNAVLGLGAMGALTLGLWSSLMSCPPLFMLGLIALTLFKVVDFDYHLSFYGTRQRTETIARVAIFAGPIATLIIPIGFSFGIMPVLWNGIAMPNAEIRLESFVLLPMIWASLYTVLDAALAFYRRYKSGKNSFLPYEIGTFVASVLTIFTFALLRIDTPTSQAFLMAAIFIQCLGNLVPFFSSNANFEDVRLDSPIFSTSHIRCVLEQTKEIFDENWLVQIVIDRPTPRHIVSLTLTDSEESFGGLDLNILTENWRDFLEVFRIEGTVITGDAQEHDARNPVQGIADKLGIVIALPIADNVAGTLSSLTFLVSSKRQPNSEEVVSMSLTAKQRDRLAEIIEDLRDCAPAAVYQSAEISLEFVGEDIDDFARRYHETASFARSLKNPTAQLDPRAIPHGLLDEDDVIEDDIRENSDTKLEKNEKTSNNIASDFSCETRQYEEEIQLLRSQVAALYSQQLRAYSLNEISFTHAQREVLDEMESIDPPILILGEPGTGKRMLALASHQKRNSNAFLTIDAAVISESIFALDMFGDGQEPGLITSAAGGSLLIQNADKVSENLLDEVIEMIEKLPAKDNVALYLSVNIAPDDFSVEQFRLDPAVLPENLQGLAKRTDAEIVVVDSLRVQDDLDTVADFFCQKQAFSAGKNVEGFTSEAMLALKSYAWPGNFMELRSVVERAVMRCEGAMIGVNDLGRDFVEIADASTKNIAISGSDVFREQVQLMQILNETQQNQIQQLNERIRHLEEQLQADEFSKDEAAEDDFLNGSFADIEKRLLDKILDKYQRDPDKAAEALELNRTRFINKLMKYKIHF